MAQFVFITTFAIIGIKANILQTHEMKAAVKPINRNNEKIIGKFSEQ